MLGSKSISFYVVLFDAAIAPPCKVLMVFYCDIICHLVGLD